MKFSEIPSDPLIKQKLIQTIEDQRVSHAQLFFGPEGSGKLALAIGYAQLINCTSPSLIEEGIRGGACGTCPSCIQYQKLAHPDLHFFYPVATSKKVPSKPSSKHYINEWREFLLSNDCQVSLSDWYEFIGIGNKQGTIYTEDANEINRILSYKSYESEYKVVIIWMIEKLYHQAAPKLLKILEEPPEKTLFILVSDNPDHVIPTILSRCLPVRIPRIPDKEIRAYLLSKTGCSQEEAQNASRASQGNIKQALFRLRQEEDDRFIFETFRNWMRLCFSGNISGLIGFATEGGKIGREKQKSLLQYGLRVAGNSTALQYGLSQQVAASGEEMDFIHKFSPFLSGPKVPVFYELFNSAIYHIERNAHAPTLFLDLSLKITRHIKR